MPIGVVVISPLHEVVSVCDPQTSQRIHALEVEVQSALILVGLASRGDDLKLLGYLVEIDLREREDRVEGREVAVEAAVGAVSAPGGQRREREVSDGQLCVGGNAAQRDLVARVLVGSDHPIEGVGAEVLVEVLAVLGRGAVRSVGILLLPGQPADIVTGLRQRGLPLE